MESKLKLVDHFQINPEYKQALEAILVRWRLSTRVDILVVVDTNISTAPGVGFGIATVIEHVRNTTVGCMKFNIDIALRNGEAPSVVSSPGDYDPKYRGFRFDMQDDGTDVINKYEQIWCFGFKPSNSGSADDAEIDQASAYPTSDDELVKLSDWMDNRKGGLFGTGDHHFLGASMCRRIPRLGTMRRWTNLDGVPPIDTEERIDTLRPPSAAYEPSAPGGPLELENNAHQGDLTVQPIRWASWKYYSSPFFIQKRPHSLLCHPTLGPIDVMPDHAHEGLCVPTAEIDLNHNYEFTGKPATPEYPDSTSGGTKPKPVIIAYGSTLGSPPYAFHKGEQPARASFPMISAYDGHQAGVGRVATDSTWHHWMGFNIDAIKAADTEDWKKISRYFVNLAVWLNPPNYSTKCLYLDSLVSHFQYVGFEEYRSNLAVRDLGQQLRYHLSSIYGPCWVTERIRDIIWEVRPKPWEIIQKLQAPVEFESISAELIEDAFLGEIVMQTMKTAEEIKEAASVGKREVSEDIAAPEKLVQSAVDKTLKVLSTELAERCKSLNSAAEALRG